MRFVEDYNLLNEKLEVFKKESIKQLDAIDFDTKEFHKTLINLLSKYPEHKDLLEFTVYINDRIEMNQVQFKEILKDIIEDTISLKQEHILKDVHYRKQWLDKTNNIVENNPIQVVEEPKQKSNVLDVLDLLPELKIILLIIFGIVATIGFVVAPDTTKQVFSWLMTIILPV